MDGGAADHELAAPYALGALTQTERRRFEEHLEQCPPCRLELPGFEDAAAALALAVQPAEPPPLLRARILDATHPSRARAVPLGARRLSSSFAAGLAAVAACAAIGFGIWAAVLSSELGRSYSARAVAILADPHAVRYPLYGARGQVVVAPTREAALVVERLGRAPHGSTYELWVVVAQRPRPAGVFEGGGDQTVVALSRHVPAGAQVAVSLEPGHGGLRLTGALLFGAQTV